MSDLNEKLAQEAAELINGGEWRDGKWYSDGQRDAWRRALKAAADRIEQLDASSEGWKEIADEYFDAIGERNTRIEKLEAALKPFLQLPIGVIASDPADMEVYQCHGWPRDGSSVVTVADFRRVQKALEGKDD